VAHRKIAYVLGMHTAVAQFKKEAREYPGLLRRLLEVLKDKALLGDAAAMTGITAVPSMVPGALLGAGTGALTSDEGHRGMGALRGAGLGALLGGVGGGVAGVGSALRPSKSGLGTTGEALERLLQGAVPGSVAGGAAGGYLGRKTED
jgi:hypothetical protein